MLSENLVMLRNLKGLTQEQVAEVVEISRQSYVKWEQGETVKLGNRGQIVIPKEARDKYGFQEGSRLVVLGDEDGIALIQAEKFESQLKSALELSRKMVAED